MQHISFLYLSICYAGSLPALTAGWIAYRRTRDRTIGQFLPLLTCVTAQLVLSAILQYWELNLPAPYSLGHAVITYLYFIAESGVIFTLPYLAHFLIQGVSARRLDRFFAFLWLAALLLIVSPLSLRYLPATHEIGSLPGLYVYRCILFAVILYAVSVIFLYYKRIERGYPRLLLMLALVFTLLWLAQLVHCRLTPFLPGFFPGVNLEPAGFMIWNCFYLVFVSQRHSPPAAQTPNIAGELFTRHRLTGREAEIVRLLLDGRQNKEIAGELHIAEATVKTHILNIYKKLGLRNRVQLARLFLGH